MPTDWSREEVEATVADYFAMFELDLSGIPYNKTEHRNRLLRFLNNRSASAVEWKHQNISAVLHDLGFPCIPGYKPRSNFQNLLFEVVEDRLRLHREVAEIVKNQVVLPASKPELGDILATLVDAPRMDNHMKNFPRAAVKDKPRIRKGTDYLALESQNRQLGAAGEQFVLQFEIERLYRAGKGDLASRVERVSETRGDGLGYDVLSFEMSGRERLIEVKTTAYGPMTPFFVSQNEVAVSHEISEQYCVYRAFSFRRDPKLFIKRGALDQNFTLDAVQFLARLA